jgi:hypothetical protein
MIKMGRVYEEEGNLEAAYVLYLKYITLFLEKINTHRSEQRVAVIYQRGLKAKWQGYPIGRAYGSVKFLHRT